MCHVAVEIRRGSSRFMERHPARATWHSFSFGEHYDADRISFGPMVCHDDHRLSSGEGFPTHSHRDLVIVTWVLNGSLTHTDSSGSTAEVVPGSVAVLHAGAGVEHSEMASSPQTRFVQVWLADDTEHEPSYDVTPVDVAGGSLVPVVTPQAGATFSVARLEAGQTATLAPSALQHVFVARGALTRFSLAEPLHDGDALLMTAEPAHEVTAAVPTELLVWSFDRTMRAPASE
jgi:redox-sensitive bicupin YhaK (pirin superfamily)